MRTLGFPEADYSKSWGTPCPKGVDKACVTPQWHHHPCGGMSGVVRKGWRGKVIPQIAILGRLAVLHKWRAALAHVLRFPSVIWFLALGFHGVAP